MQVHAFQNALPQSSPQLGLELVGLLDGPSRWLPLRQHPPGMAALRCFPPQAPRRLLTTRARGHAGAVPTRRKQWRDFVKYRLRNLLSYHHREIRGGGVSRNWRVSSQQVVIGSTGSATNAIAHKSKESRIETARLQAYCSGARKQAPENTPGAGHTAFPETSNVRDL